MERQGLMPCGSNLSDRESAEKEEAGPTAIGTGLKDRSTDADYNPAAAHMPSAEIIHKRALQLRKERTPERLIASALCALAALEPEDFRIVIESIAGPLRWHPLDDALDDPVDRLAWAWRDATPDERRRFLDAVTGRAAA